MKSPHRPLLSHIPPTPEVRLTRCGIHRHTGRCQRPCRRTRGSAHTSARPTKTLLPKRLSRSTTIASKMVLLAGRVLVHHLRHCFVTACTFVFVAQSTLVCSTSCQYLTLLSWKACLASLTACVLIAQRVKSPSESLRVLCSDAEETGSCFRRQTVEPL